MTYGKRLAIAIEAAKTSRKALAKYIGCTPQILGMVISGAGKAERKLSTDNHAMAVEFLKVSDKWLLNGDGPMEINHATAPLQSPQSTFRGSASNQAVSRIERAEAAIEPVAMSAQCRVLCEMFETLPNDPVLRGKILSKLLDVVNSAHDPTPSFQDAPAKSRAVAGS